MSDLTDEMRLLAADAAMEARPMAITEVIRRGNRRRTRTLAQRSVGGLSALGIGAAVLVTGVTHHAASNAAAAGSAANNQTVTVTHSSRGGQITLNVKYRLLPTRKIELLSVTYSGDSTKALTKKDVFFAFFGPGLNSGKPSIPVGFSVPVHLSSPHHFSGSLSAKTIKQVNKGTELGKNGSVSLSMASVVKWTPSSKHQKATLKLSTKVDLSKAVSQIPPAIAILSS